MSPSGAQEEGRQGKVSKPEAQPDEEAGGSDSASGATGGLHPTCWAQSPPHATPRLPKACLPTPLSGIQKIDFLTAIHQPGTSSCWCDTCVPRVSST